MSDLEGICPKCGLHYNGWALNWERNHMCVKCGSTLEIRKDGFLISRGFSPLRAEKYECGAYQDNWGDLSDKNLLFFLYLTRN
jgi:hypothetical protein